MNRFDVATTKNVRRADVDVGTSRRADGLVGGPAGRRGGRTAVVDGLADEREVGERIQTARDGVAGGNQSRCGTPADEIRRKEGRTEGPATTKTHN